jgi:chromosome partitioning protein
MKVMTMMGKGGAGKSTTGFHLAYAGQARGYRVLLVDADPQGSLKAWSSLRGSDDIRVKPATPEQVEALLRKAERFGYDFAIIDNAPVINAHSAAIARRSDLVIVPTRVSFFDLRVALDWVSWLQTVGRRSAVVINAAPAMREGQESPLVRDARRALNSAGAAVWRQQITQRHVIIAAAASGRSVAELVPVGAAAREYEALWDSLGKAVGDERKVS